MAGLKFHQHINVAVGTEVFPQHGAKECQLADVMAPTEFSNLPSGNEVGSGVMVGVVGEQTFGLGDGDQALVSREKC